LLGEWNLLLFLFNLLILVDPSLFLLDDISPVDPLLFFLFFTIIDMSYLECIVEFLNLFLGLSLQFLVEIDLLSNGWVGLWEDVSLLWVHNLVSDYLVEVLNSWIESFIWI
jgi:hypothetical protein